MANDNNLAAQVGTARSAMRRELGDAPHPAIYAFDGITMPLLAIAGAAHSSTSAAASSERRRIVKCPRSSPVATPMP